MLYMNYIFRIDRYYVGCFHITLYFKYTYIYRDFSCISGTVGNLIYTLVNSDVTHLSACILLPTHITGNKY